jgi:23S rRNA (guanosine2251-2'-O)-methyltransferase
MKTKNSRERSKSGKNNYRARPEDNKGPGKTDATRGGYKSEDTRGTGKTEVGRGGYKKDESTCSTKESRITYRADGTRGRNKPDPSKATSKGDGPRGKYKSEEARRTTKPWVNKEDTRTHTFDEEMHPDLIIGRNPVAEAIKSGRTIEKIFVGKGTGGSILKIVGGAKDKGLPIIYMDKQGLDRIAGCEQHQGIIAQVSPYEYKTIDDIFALAKERGEEPLIVALDNLEDPHNLGAIIRSAEGAGAHGVIIPKRHGVGVTQVVIKTSAGAIEYIPVVKVTNIGDTLEELKKKGLWIAACDMGGTEYSKQELKGPLAMVIGSEGVGIGRLIKERSDFVVSIPMKGHVASLNASNAAAILLYEIRRQRDSKL